jgi:hypothetical protein
MPGESRCKICSTVFERINNNSCYCSQECRAIGYEETKARGRENAKKRYQERQEAKRRNCVHCGQEFKPIGSSKTV